MMNKKNKKQAKAQVWYDYVNDMLWIFHVAQVLVYDFQNEESYYQLDKTQGVIEYADGSTQSTSKQDRLFQQSTFIGYI